MPRNIFYALTSTFAIFVPMATIKLKNTTNAFAKLGSLVRIDPKNANAFQYVTDLTKLDVIGTVAQSGGPGSLCTINLINEGVSTSTSTTPTTTVSSNSYFPVGW